jgi:hypothetical protein
MVRSVEKSVAIFHLLRVFLFDIHADSPSCDRDCFLDIPMPRVCDHKKIWRRALRNVVAIAGLYYW